MNTDTAADYHAMFGRMGAEEILGFLLEKHAGKTTFSTSLGAEDQVITHMLSQTGKPVDLFTLDTGRLFYETYDLLEKTNRRYKLGIRVLFPDTSKIESMVRDHGINLFYHSVENRKYCCQLRKLEPLQRGLKNHEIWITGLRREQSPTRNQLTMAEWDATHRIIKVNPLMDWSEDALWDYIKAHNIPYNPLHDQGYPSIGCQPCTRAVMPGENIRSGRWWWEQPETKECGLHTRKA